MEKSPPKLYVPIERQPLHNLNRSSIREENIPKSTQDFVASKVNHEYKQSYTSNVDTNKFIDTSKSEEKNRLLPERHLLKLFQVSGDENAKFKTGLRENVSFDQNTQVLAAIRQNDSVTNKLSQASHFTFNSTEKLGSRDLNSVKNKVVENDKFAIKNFANRLVNHSNSQAQELMSDHIHEGVREGNLGNKSFPIMNSVRQVLQKGSDRSVHLQTKLLDHQSSMQTVESKDSTKVIRERLRGKIDNLRDRISSSHKETMRSIPENFQIPINKISQCSDANQAIDTVRVHSRDGSKSIDGSGLELDDYIDTFDHVAQRRSNADNKDNRDIIIGLNHRNESVRSANTYQSKWREFVESFKDPEVDARSRINITAGNSYNNTFHNTKNLGNHFTIEEVSNAENKSPTIPSRNHEWLSFQNSNTQNMTSKTMKNNQVDSCKRKKQSKQSNKSHSILHSRKRSKNDISRGTNNSFSTHHAKKSRSSSKIKPYKKPWRSGMSWSQKRKLKRSNLNHTGTIHIEDRSSMVPQQELSISSDNSGSNLGTYCHMYNHTDFSHIEPKAQALSSMTSKFIKKADISPKRTKSYYKKKRKNSLVKPPIRPYNKSLEKKYKQSKAHPLPPKYKSSTTMNSAEKKRSVKAMLQQRTRDISVTKVTKRIFKQISECLTTIDQNGDYNRVLGKLIVIDKLCFTSFDETDVVTIFVKYLMVLWYYKCQDYDRCIRQIEAITKRVFQFYKKRKLKRETANLLMHIHKIWADVLMMKQRFDKAAQIYTELLDLYSIWRSCSYRWTRDFWIDYEEYEFTEDHVLEAKSSCGEALMNSGETLLAIERFEEAKVQFQKCLIFSNELIYVNICNQLANWYISLNKKEKALQNFEISKKTLEASRDELSVDNMILAKILSNIASIYLEQDKLLDAIKLYQSWLKIKRRKLPEYHEEIELTYCNLADAYNKVGEFTEAYDCYDHAYEISKNINGKQNKTTAKHILNWARMKYKCSEFEDAIKLYEYAGKLYQYIEQGMGKQGKSICLKLIEIYSEVREETKVDNHVNQLLEALETSKNTDDKYMFYNDLANLQKSQEQYKLAVELYKRALQTVKIVHRKNYMYLKQTAKILFNLGEVYTLTESYQNAVKYLDHSLNVMNNTRPMANIESAKVQIKLAESQSKWGMTKDALRNYEQGIDIIENIPNKDDSKLVELHSGAKKQLKKLRSSLFVN